SRRQVPPWAVVTSKISEWLPPRGVTPQMVLQRADRGAVGWGGTGATRPAHYGWLVGVDPRGGLYFSGIGNERITRVRQAKSGDLFFPDVQALFRYDDSDTTWRY